MKYFPCIEKNLPEILTTRLVVTFSLYIDENFLKQEVPMT